MTDTNDTSPWMEFDPSKLDEHEREAFNYLADLLDRDTKELKVNMAAYLVDYIDPLDTLGIDEPIEAFLNEYRSGVRL